MRDEDDYFALAHILTRRLSQGGPKYTNKSDPFFKFIETQVAKKDEPLRVLIAGANTDGNIPAVEEEALRLADSIKSNLKILDIPHEITLLVGEDVTYNKLRSALIDGQHIFHFAGHGDFDNSAPEKSPLILKDRDLTAADLKLLTQGTQLRFVFLSCCLAARTGSQVGRGDFDGFLHALALADVPAALAYRWEVRDDSAIDLATDFYELLWRYFCPGQALLHSRQKISSGEDGRDDETWAAPILLLQTT
jgi:CHAT domain-containing protein